MTETKEKRGFQFKSRYLIGLLGIAVGIYGIVSAINKRNKRKKMERTIQEWSDQQRKYEPVEGPDTIKFK